MIEGLEWLYEKDPAMYHLYVEQRVFQDSILHQDQPRNYQTQHAVDMLSASLMITQTIEREFGMTNEQAMKYYNVGLFVDRDAA